MLKQWRLAVTMLKRECRAGQWLIVFFALILAVTMITAINFFTNRLAAGLDEQSAQLLGGDLVISSAVPIPDTWHKKANELSLRTADVLIFPSVISANNQLQLVNIQAVSKNYPLFGAPLQIDKKSILAELRLLSLLTLHIGDAVTIGATSFKLESLLPSDIEMMNTGWAIAPRVLMRIDDVPATQVVLPGSRVDYRLLITGNKRHIEEFRKFIAPQLKTSQTILDVDNQRYMLLSSLHHADKYIQLVILFCLLMCGTAITLSVRQHLHRHYEDVALWRCIGAPQKQITHTLFLQFIIVALIAGTFGTILGYISHVFIVEIFKFYIKFTLPPPGLTPVLLGFLTSSILLFCYAYPIISVLPRTSPLYLWRNEAIKNNSHNVYTVITLILLLSYVYWIMDFSLLALFILDALLLSIGFLYVLNILSLSLMRKLVNVCNGSVRRGLSQFIQYPETAGIQLTAFTLIVMSLLVLSNTKHNLLDNWQMKLPAHTPNFFAFNIAPHEMESVAQFLKNAQIHIEDIYPMVRGRLATLNGKPIMTAIPQSAQQHNALHRELNMSSMLRYPSDNKIVSGSAWNSHDNGKFLISIEQSLASELHLHVGDKLGFNVGDQEITATIYNIRSVDWGSFHPNFYVIFPPETLNRFSSTFITSFHLTPTQTPILNQLVRAFPNVTIIDIAGVLRQIQALLAKLSSALQYLFAFAIIAALLIFIANLLSSMDERRQTYRLLRVLGANRKFIVISVVVEFSFLAGLTLLFAILLSKVISQLLISLIF